jgi:outer membrane receptor for ferrienterochelin and colicins
MKFYLLLFATLACHLSHAQNTFKAVVKDDKTKLPLPGAMATITSLNLGGKADTTGQITVTIFPAASTK